MMSSKFPTRDALGKITVDAVTTEEIVLMLVWTTTVTPENALLNSRLGFCLKQERQPFNQWKSPSSGPLPLCRVVAFHRVLFVGNCENWGTQTLCYKLPSVSSSLLWNWRQIQAMPLVRKRSQARKAWVPTPLEMMRGGWFYLEHLPVLNLQPLGGTSAAVTVLKNPMTQVRGFLTELGQPAHVIQ